MARRKNNSADGKDLEGLRDLVAQSGETPDNEPKTQTRRGLLRMAGAALAGAAGVAALKAVPAAAATGDPVLQGCVSFVSVNNSTLLAMAGGTPLDASTGIGFGAQSSNGISGGGLYTTTPSLEVGVFGGSKSAGQPGTGVYGHAGSGRGVQGVASSGTGGLFYSSSGYDAQLGFSGSGGQTGTGRLSQVGRTDTGSSGPPFVPFFAVHTVNTSFFQHEIVRGNFDGSIWATRYDTTAPTVTPHQFRWKRINTLRVDTADGLGSSLKPLRLYDSRSGSPLGPFATGVIHTHTVAGQGAGAQHIPADAVAVTGNLTAVGFSQNGFLTIFPAGATYDPNHDPSSMNFSTGQYAIANSFVCGLTGGALKVYVGIFGTSKANYIIDITGYIQ